MTVYTAQQIRNLITGNADSLPQEIANLIDKESRDAVLAWTHAYEEYDSTEQLDLDDLEDEMQRVYRQCWDTAAAFAEHVAEDETEMGMPEESKGRAWFLEHYGKWIDWDAVAQGPEIAGTYELIMLDPKNSREVHAFEMDA